MAEPFIGQIIMFGGSFAPKGWALCDGNLLAIESNQALFSILGTTYGGDGRTTFGLPDLRGRVSVHAGSGPGLNTIRLGQKAGSETLSASDMPSHTHTANLRGVNEKSNTTVPRSTSLGISEQNMYYGGATTPDQNLASGSVTVDSAGGSSSDVNIRNPYVAVNYIIALVGTYPSRN